MIRHHIAVFVLSAGAMLASAISIPIAAIAGFATRFVSDWPTFAPLERFLRQLAESFAVEPPFAYAGPDAPALLRHEAGTHRRAAARAV